MRPVLRPCTRSGMICLARSHAEPLPNRRLLCHDERYKDASEVLIESHSKPNRTLSTYLPTRSTRDQSSSSQTCQTFFTKQSTNLVQPAATNFVASSSKHNHVLTFQSTKKQQSCSSEYGQPGHSSKQSNHAVFKLKASCYTLQAR